MVKKIFALLLILPLFSCVAQTKKEKLYKSSIRGMERAEQNMPDNEFRKHLSLALEKLKTLSLDEMQEDKEEGFLSYKADDFTVYFDSYDLACMKDALGYNVKTRLVFVVEGQFSFNAYLFANRKKSFLISFHKEEERILYKYVFDKNYSYEIVTVDI